ILINGALATSYTFKQDYYFMMGDNRHNSADSRFWGFVPHDHIVGKAVFIWLSRSTNRSFPNIRTERVFSFIRNDGVSSSYFLHIMIPLVLLILGWNNRNRFRTQH
ncbi:MAG TPA: signal peptidase I, partial [Flavobacteriales bacterium]|nr:signal peptidase I [Flavobacteriales bacterium]